MKVVITDAALADLEAIGRHIARDNPARALTFIDELLERSEEIGDSPKAYALIPRYEEQGVRRRVHGNYLIFYRLTGGKVEVLRILHGAQDYEHILFPNDQ